jgi:uncharacterized membrane protein
LPFAAACLVLLAACGKEAQPDSRPETPSVADEIADGIPAQSEDTAPYSGIGDDEVVNFTGTEPFWGGELAGKTLTYKTPEKPDGEVIMVERFAGRGGISFSGVLDGAELEMVVTPLECSDGMSDRTYPFTVTLKIGDETRNGCGWTERQPFGGPAHP